MAEVFIRGQGFAVALADPQPEGANFCQAGFAASLVSAAALVACPQLWQCSSEQHRANDPQLA